MVEQIDLQAIKTRREAAIAKGKLWHLTTDELTAMLRESNADLSRANLGDANLRRANLSEANLSEANLSRADLSEANLRWANLSEANLSRADLSRANLSEANLSRADLSRANLSEANLRWANLSEARGLLNPSEWLKANFEQSEKGYIVYKTFGSNYSPNTAWIIESGQFITEVVNPCPVSDCACGVNVATLDWVKRNNEAHSDVWKCLVHWEDLPSVVVPYHTDGKFRAGRVQLIETV